MDARISVNSGRYRRLSPPGAAALSIWELAAPRAELARALGLASLPEVDRPRRIVAGGRDPFDEGVLWLRAVGERECRAELHLHGGAGVAGSLRAVLDEFGWSETAVPLDPDRQRFLRARAPLAARAAADAFASGLTARIAAAGAGTVAERERLARELLADEAWARLLEEPPLLALAGPPNAGKSTLFNAWLREERTTVSPHPGTTRDAVEAGILLGSGAEAFEVRLVDTAGWWLGARGVDRRALAASRRLLRRAWRRIWVLDVAQEPEQDLLALAREGERAGDLVLLHRDDLDPVWNPPAASRGWLRGSVHREGGTAVVVRLEQALLAGLGPPPPAGRPLALGVERRALLRSWLDGPGPLS